MAIKISADKFSSASGLLGGGLVLILPDKTWIGWVLIGLAVIVYITGVSFDNGHIRYSQPYGWRSRMSPMIWMIIGVVGAIVAATSFYQAYGMNKGGWPLKVQFGSILNLYFSQEIPGFQVWGIEGSARNMSGGEVTLETAYIISGKTGKRIPVLFSDGYGKYLKPTDFNPMPPKAEVHFRALFNTDKEFISEQAFWDSWGPVTFVATYNGREFTKVFSAQELQEQFDLRRPKFAPPLMTPKTTELPERDTKADRALAYIETGNWNHTYNEFMGLAYENKGSSFNKFRQAALDDKLRVWGKSGPHSPYHLIEKDYWNVWKLEVLSCIGGECKTEVATGLPRVEKRYDLMVSKAEIEKTWPQKT